MRAWGGDLLARTVRAIEIGEDSIHAIVSALLVVLGMALVVDTVHHTVVILAGTYNLPVIVLGALVVGLVAGIRRVLILTAEAEQSFRWNPEGIELLILMALILVMAATTYVWRKFSGPTAKGTAEGPIPGEESR